MRREADNKSGVAIETGALGESDEQEEALPQHDY